MVKRFQIKYVATTGGILYLIVIVFGVFTFVRSRLTVPGNIMSTANNIAGSEFIWRLGFSAEIFMLLCDAGIALILYILLRPVDKNIALFAMLLRIISITISAANSLNHFAVLFYLNADYLKVFEPQQIQALAYMPLRMHAYGYNISLVFFGLCCMVLGHLIFRSGYFPKNLGVVMGIVGLCYIVNSFSWFLVPEFAAKIFPGILLPCLLGEFYFTMWLLLKGGKIQTYLEKIPA